MINITQYLNLCELDLMFTKEKFQEFLNSNKHYEGLNYNNQHWFTSIGGFAAQYNIAGLTYNDKHLKFPVFIDDTNELICHDAINRVFGKGFDDEFYYNVDRDSFDNAKDRLNTLIKDACQDHIKHIALDLYRNDVKEHTEKDCCTQDSSDPHNVTNTTPLCVNCGYDPIHGMPVCDTIKSCNDEVKSINPVKSIYDITIDPNLTIINGNPKSYQNVISMIEDTIAQAKQAESPYVIYQIEEHEKDIINMLSLRSDFHNAGYDAYLNYEENRMIIRLI